MKNLITKVLVNRTKKYLAKTNPKIVAIAGSVGKTTVTQATATILAEKYKVKATYANYNTELGVILTIFDQKIQTNPIKWAFTAFKIWQLSKGRPKYDVYVLELGTDKQGEMERFAYLNPKFGIITAIAPEHMEYFKEISAVAMEELALTSFCKTTILGEGVADEWVEKYAHGEVIKTGEETKTKIENFNLTTRGCRVIFNIDGKKVEFESKHIAEHLIKGLVAPALLAKDMGLTLKEIKSGLEKVAPLPGRMQLLDGLNGSTIFDDTYNSSPEAVKSALDTLYKYPAEKKIALLGMMNELGATSIHHHKEMGQYCEPSKLDLVVTLGSDANEFTASEAIKRGCRVVKAMDAFHAAEIIKDELTPSTVMLAKGSQNGVYAEEAIKLLLRDPVDSEKLVRQNDYWPNKKNKIFKNSNFKVNISNSI